MSKYRVSADIGGTFTDIVVQPDDQAVFVGKVATTPDNPARGVVEGIAELIPDLSDVSFFVHGTTVGLNAFLERRGERVLLVTTAGARDSFTIARGNRQTLYELRYQKPEQLVPRRDIHEVRGRLGWDGEEIAPLVLEDFDDIIEKVKREGFNAVAICFLHAFAHPQHEIKAREHLKAALPDVSISVSHEIAREWREYERASSTVMNAYVAPVVERYLKSLQRELKERQMNVGVHIMQSSGGVTTAQRARETPVFTLLSGPVGGTIAGKSLALSSGRENLLCVDMGGTSFDLSLVVRGEANTTLETELEGLPLLMSIVDIQTIGTGGGSVAWLENGAMRVGPHSAGSQPGPACYGRGGTQPTVTDANLYLGRLGARSLLGGNMSLDLSAAETAIRSLADQVGLSAEAFAEGVLTISNAAMADAMRTITVSQGVDPREFTLVAFGGAGPMAAVFLAEELDINEVLVPRFPGTFSAWGMLQTDMRQDKTLSYFAAAAGADIAAMESAFQQLEQAGEEQILSQGVGSSDIYFGRTADMRYVGQEYSINVPFESEANLELVLEAFHEAHELRYGHSSPAAPVEFVNLRVATFGKLEGQQQITSADAAGDAAALANRSAIFGGKSYETPIFARDHMGPSFSQPGPMIVEEQSATTVVPPGWQVTVDKDGNLILRRGQSS